MTQLYWGKSEATGFTELLNLIPDAVLASPRRSVVPLVDFCRYPDQALKSISGVTGIHIGATANLCFEYAVSVQQGRGKPSYTDLVILTPETAIVIEAKYTEPQYETVLSWLRDPREPNRMAVLEGWLKLINRVAGRMVVVDDILDLPYQLVHRCASACHSELQQRAIIYLIFGKTVPEHYREHAKRLDVILSAPGTIPIFVLSCPVTALPQYHRVVQLWDAGQRKLSDAVRQTLAEGPAFKFGELHTSYVSPSVNVAS